MAARNQLLGMAAMDPALTKVRPNALEDVPEYRIDVDWDKAGALGAPINSIHNTISAAFGSAYVNDFIQAGQVKRVYVQADALPHAARQSGKIPCAQQLGQDGSLFRLCFRQLGFRFSEAASATTAFPPSTFRASRRRAGVPARRWRPWKGLSKSCRREPVLTGPGCPTRNGCRVPRRPAVRLFRFRDLPVPGGALRELAHSISVLLTLPLGAIGGVIASSLRGAAQRRLFSDRTADHPGPGHQERHLIVQFAKAGRGGEWI